MTTVTFESATVSDVLKRASKFTAKSVDGTNGIYIHITETGIVVRATNSELFIIIWSSYVNKNGPAVDWYIPAHIAKLCEHLSQTTGKTVTFSDDENPGFITVTQEKSRSTTPLIRGVQYPTWDVFTEEQSSVVHNLGSRLDQVRWACAGTSDQSPPPLQGVYFDGTHILATNRYVAARVPVKIDTLTSPVTVPASVIAEAIRNDGDVRVTRTSGGMGISPDPYTQIFVRAFGDNPAGKLTDRLPRDCERELEVNSEHITSVIQRMLQIFKNRDELYVRVAICNEQITMSITSKGSTSEEILDIPGNATWEEEEVFYFDPHILNSCLSKTPTNTVKLAYTVGKSMMYVSSGTYEAWIAKKEKKDEKAT